MAVTCGLPLNNAMASAVNMLGDVHGGAGEQAVQLFHLVMAHDGSVSNALNEWKNRHGKIIPGFGHRFHKPKDPRAPRLMELVDKAVDFGACDGKFAQIAQQIETVLSEKKGTPIPMNIDGATAVIYAELGFAPPPCTRVVLLVALGWYSGALLGTNEPRRTKQGANPTALPMDL
jgi:citrate synthase